MPWKEVTVMQEKLKFIENYNSWEGTFSSLCKLFGISRKTGYKYISRHNKKGKAGLQEKSRRPKFSPFKTSKQIEEIILEVRKLHPSWSGEKIKNYLIQKGAVELPSAKTINQILKRNGFISEEESQKHMAFIRFEHEHPNDLWQMDFKGHFATHMGRCHPLTLLDDHSRYSLVIKACSNEQLETVKTALIAAFRQYGLPLKMTMDNGSPWGCSNIHQKHTALTAWLMHLGIYVTHSRPNHPQTQGKLERFHRTLNVELIKRFSFNDLAEAQDGFNWWRKIYNEERPHQAIGFDVPKNRYRESDRVYPETLPTIEYESMIVRKVQREGILSFRGKPYTVGKGFGGCLIGIKETMEDGILDVYFCHQRIGKIDTRSA